MTRPVKLMIFTVLALSITSTFASFDPSVCTRRPLTPLILGGCLNKCTTFTPSDFDKCSALSSFGCTNRPCGDPKDRYAQCALDPTYLSNITICAGNTLELHNVEYEALSNGVSYSVGIRVPPKTPRYKKTDIFIVADANSGTEVAERARSIAYELVGKFSSVNDGSVQIGFGVLRNKRKDKDGFSVRSRITADFNHVRKWIRKFRAQYTGEPNMQATIAFSSAAHIGWRTDANRILVYAAARPFTEPMKVTASDGSTFCYSRNRAVAFLKSALVTTFPIDLGDINGFPLSDGCEDLPEAETNQADFIAMRTGGMTLNGNYPGVAVDSIVSNVENIPRFSSVGFHIGDCGKYLSSVKNEPSFPIQVPAGGQTTVHAGLSVKSTVCGNKWAKCTLRYTLDSKPYTSVGLVFKHIIC